MKLAQRIRVFESTEVPRLVHRNGAQRSAGGSGTQVDEFRIRSERSARFRLNFSAGLAAFLWYFLLQQQKKVHSVMDSRQGEY